MKWQDITVGQFEQLTKYNGKDNEQFTTKAIEIIFGIEKADRTLSLAEYMQHVGQLSFMNEKIPSKKIPLKYEREGRKYFIDIEPTRFTAAQFLDFKEMRKNPDNLTDILSVVVIPVGHKYNDGYDIEQAKEDIREMSVVDGQNIVFFFARWFQTYVRYFQGYFRLQKRMRKTSPQMREVMERIERFLSLIPTV